MNADLHPRGYPSRQAFVEACVPESSYGWCNPMKVSMAEEDARDAGARWDAWHADAVALRRRVETLERDVASLRRGTR